MLLQTESEHPRETVACNKTIPFCNIMSKQLKVVQRERERGGGGGRGKERVSESVRQ